MIHIDFDPAKLTGPERAWWVAWETRATNATKEVLDAWEASRKNPTDVTYKTIFDKPALKAVWTDLKNWLLANVFNNKCAYCETPVVRATLQAEHYRPKGRVTQNGKKVKIKDQHGKDLDHPGYFWLAFHWTNLLPACEWCNTVNGKRNEFPIPTTTYLSVLKSMTPAECAMLKQQLIPSSSWPNIFYFQPVDLDDKEGRLLLHPYFDDPRKSLRFDDFGKVIAFGKGDDKLRGEWSRKAYNLNDERIIPERRRAQEEALNMYDTIFKFHRVQDKSLSIEQAKLLVKANQTMAGYLNGKEPYSAAVVDYLRLTRDKKF